MPDYPPDTAAAMATWLARRMSQVRQHEAAGQIVAGVTAAVRQAQRAIDRPPSRVYGGPCPSCGADLLGQPGEPTVTCPGCGAGYNLATRRAVMEGQLRIRLADTLGTPDWCTTAASACGLHITAAVIRVWASRKRLTVRPGGLYRFGDIAALIDERDAARTG